MPQQKSWVMSLIVVGTYVCAIYGARGTSVSASPPLVRPSAQRPARVPATQAVSVCDIER